MSTSKSSDFQHGDATSTQSKATLPDVSRLINEIQAEEAEALGVTPAWQAAVNDSKRQTRIDDAEPTLNGPTEVIREQATGPDTTIQSDNSAAILTMPSQGDRQLRVDMPEEIQPTQVDSDSDVLDRSLDASELPEATVATLNKATTPEVQPAAISAAHSMSGAVARTGEKTNFGASALAALKKFIKSPWTKQVGKYSAIVLATVSVLMLLDSDKRPDSASKQADSPTNQAPLHGEPLQASQADAHKLLDELESQSSKRSQRASHETPSERRPMMASRPRSSANKRPELRQDGRTDAVARSANPENRPTSAATEPRRRNDRDSNFNRPASDPRGQRRADWDRQSPPSRVNDARENNERRPARNERMDFRAPTRESNPAESNSRFRDDSLDGPDFNGPAFNASGYRDRGQNIQPVAGYEYEETNVRNYQYPRDAIPRAISIIRNRKLR